MTTPDPMRCTARSKQRNAQCKRTAIPGGTVCRYHGGAAPQVMKAAAERLKELQFPAIVAIEDALDADAYYVVRNGDSSSVEEKPDHPTRLRAATAVLDRTGLGPTSKQEVSLEASDQLAQVLTALDG
jgi:hypothetical protein